MHDASAKPPACLPYCDGGGKKEKEGRKEGRKEEEDGCFVRAEGALQSLSSRKFRSVGVQPGRQEGRERIDRSIEREREREREGEESKGNKGIKGK